MVLLPARITAHGYWLQMIHTQPNHLCNALAGQLLDISQYISQYSSQYIPSTVFCLLGCTETRLL